MKRANNHGFTLLEVLVAATVMAVGIVGAMSTIGAILHSQSVQQQREQFRMLAFQRYNEVSQTVDLTQGGASGDFSTWNLPDVSWSATVTATGTTNLSQLDVTVTDNSQDISETVSGLVYVPSTTTTTNGSNSSTGGAAAGGAGGRGGAGGG